MDELTAALVLGLRTWKKLAAMESAAEVRRAVFDLSEEQLRAVVLQRVVGVAQDRLSPDDYAAWWS